eukprot:scaffold305838_cov31-Tisochrysis_lutea.AAC.1
MLGSGATRIAFFARNVVVTVVVLVLTHKEAIRQMSDVVMWMESVQTMETVVTISCVPTKSAVRPHHVSPAPVITAFPSLALTCRLSLDVALAAVLALGEDRLPLPRLRLPPACFPPHCPLARPNRSVQLSNSSPARCARIIPDKKRIPM